MKFVKTALFGLFFLPLILNAQEKSKTYYSSKGQVTDQANSEYLEIGWKDGGVYVDSVKTYFTRSNKLRSAEKRDEKGTRQNLYLEYFENGNVKERSIYNDGAITDSSFSFYEAGNPMSVYLYSGRRNISDVREPRIIHYWDSTGVQVVANGEGKCGCKYSWGPFEYFEEGTIHDGYRDGPWKGFKNDTLRYEEVYDKGELRKGIQHYKDQRIEYTQNQEMAEFPGGLQALGRFIGQNLKYPAYARRRGIQGLVYVAFVVRKNGALDSFDVVNIIDESLAEEALRVARLMPMWKPGTLKGLPVNSRFVLPINFKLER